MADNVVPFRGHFPYFGHFNNLVTDTWKNFVSMLGTEKDKTVAATPVVELLDMLKLDNLYRGNWVCRKIVDLPAWDCCRAWRQWQAEEDQIEKLEEAERKHGLQRKVMAAISRARLYGGAAIILGLEGCGQFNEELDLDDVGKNALKFVHVISGGRHQMITAGQRILDVTSPWFGEPSYYMRSNTPTPQPPGNVAMIETSGLGYPPGSTLYIHPSRVVRLTGLDYPDPETSMDSWGDSVLQPVYDAARASGSVSGAIAAMVQESKIDIIKMKGLSELMSTREGAQRLYDRYSNSNVAKSVINTLMLDVEEEFVRHEMHYANLDKVMTLFLLVCAAAADIPATRLLGREPAGMNATGDSDIRNYYDRLAADQEVRLRPTLSKLDEVLIRSIFGDRDEDIHYTWNPLWQMSDEEQSQVELRKAQAFAIDVNAGLIDPMALKEGRQNSLIASGFLYKGLDAAIEEAETAGDDEDIDEQQSAGLFGEQPGQFGQPGAPPGGAPAGGKPPPFGGNGKTRDTADERGEFIRDPLTGQWGGSHAGSHESKLSRREARYRQLISAKHPAKPIESARLLSAAARGKSSAGKEFESYARGLEGVTGKGAAAGPIEQVGAQTGGKTEPAGGRKASPGVPDRLVQAIEDHVNAMAGEGSRHGAGDLSEWITRAHRDDIIALTDASKDKWPILLLHKGDPAAGMPTVWMLTWSKNDTTSIHDHLESEVGVSVARGSVGNRVYSTGEGYLDKAKSKAGLESQTGEQILQRDQTVTLKSPYIHEMFGTAEPGQKRDITVHSYYPPLKQMHYFKKDNKGNLHYAGDWDEDRNPEDVMVVDAMRGFRGCPCCCLG